MTRLPTVMLVASASLFGLSVAAAQTPTPPPPGFKNLKVFPQTITRDQLMWNMKIFAQ